LTILYRYIRKDEEEEDNNDTTTSEEYDEPYLGYLKSALSSNSFRDYYNSASKSNVRYVRYYYSSYTYTTIYIFYILLS
jgi:hypothetical protein